MFEEAAGKHAPEELGGAMAEHGKLASIMTGHESHSCASEAETGKRGRTEFERRLAELGVKQIQAGQGSRTNGKLGRLREEIQRKIERFGGIDEFVRQYNHDRPHDSPDQGTLETPGGVRAEDARKGANSQRRVRWRGVSCWPGCEVVAGSHTAAHKVVYF